MSELKVRPYTMLPSGQCYDRDEVDKVLAEKDKELRRYKYKRCLDKAEIASHNWHLHNSFYLMGHKDFELKKCERYERHRMRWLELAKKFKPNEE